MVRSAIVAFLIWAAAAQSGPAQEWAMKMFKVTRHDFGTVARGAKAEFAFELTNLYKEDVHIAGVRSSCGCTSASITKPTLKTWETGAIVAVYNTRSFLGAKTATITVTIDQPYFAEVQLTVAGYIRGDVVFDPGTVDFGTVNEGSGAQASVTVSYAGRPNWRIADVRSASTNLEVELTQTQRSAGQVTYDMIVHLKPSAPAGYIQDQLTIITNDKQARAIPISVQGRVVSSLTVSPASLFLGVLTPGQKVTKTLIVRGKKPFRVTAIRCSDACFQFKTTSTPKVLHVIPVTFTAGDHPGTISQAIEIQTDLDSGTAANCTATATIKMAGASP